MISLLLAAGAAAFREAPVPPLATQEVEAAVRTPDESSDGDFEVLVEVDRVTPVKSPGDIQVNVDRVMPVAGPKVTNTIEFKKGNRGKKGRKN